MSKNTIEYRPPVADKTSRAGKEVAQATVSEERRQEVAQKMERIKLLGIRVAACWNSPMSAAEAIAEQRR